MIDWIDRLIILAQNEGGGGAGQGQAPPGGGILGLLFPLVAIGFLWYFLLLRPQRRDQAKREELLQALKKNDRVVTIGGMLGTVANMSADGTEVTIKVDDNTRIRMLRKSIQTVLNDESSSDAST